VSSTAFFDDCYPDRAVSLISGAGGTGEEAQRDLSIRAGVATGTLSSKNHEEIVFNPVTLYTLKQDFTRLRSPSVRHGEHVSAEAIPIYTPALHQ
jgi:hypothetical protein